MLRFLFFSLIMLCLFLCPSCKPTLKEKPLVIFDAEMSLNDLMSLYLFSRTDKATLLGVSVAGSTLHSFENAANHAESILSLSHADKIPVSSLLSATICSPEQLPTSWNFSSEDFSKYDFPKSLEQPLPITGAHLIHDLIDKASQKVTLLCLGPLNNLAEALLSFPEIKQKIAKVIILGGSIHTTQSVTLPFYAHWNEASIYNIFIDPCSANVILTSGIPISLIPLDTINLIPNTLDLPQEYAMTPPVNEGAKFVLQVLKDHASSDSVRAFGTFWDLIAIMTITDPTILKFQTVSIQVITEPGSSFGQLIPSSEGSPVDLCTYVDRERFYKLLFTMINQ